MTKQQNLTNMLSINKIQITPGAGCALDELKQEMSRISNKYNCEVTARFNGMDLKVNKLDDQLLQDYEKRYSKSAA